MPEARERKKADKIKEKSDRRVSPVKKTMRRRMTAKLQKELMEQKQGRESDSGLDMTPETQAAEQAERKIYTAADSLREHTSDAVSKSISRHQRKQQKKRRRTAQALHPRRTGRPRCPMYRNRSGKGPLTVGKHARRKAADPPLPHLTRQQPRNAHRQGLPRKNGCGKRPGRTPRRGTKRLGLP